MRLYILALMLVLAPSLAWAENGHNSDSPFCGLLDPRSRYGEYWFPEPLRAPEMDVDRELRVDWLHTEKRGKQNDEVVGELDYNFNLLTVEMEAPWERESGGDSGVGNIEFAARHPV